MIIIILFTTRWLMNARVSVNVNIGAGEIKAK